MHRVCVFVVTLCMCAVARVGAAADAETLALSLPAALAPADEHSPLVRRALGEGKVVESYRTSAGVARPTNPFLSFAAGERFDRSGSRPAAVGFEWGLHLEQSFEIGG